MPLNQYGERTLLSCLTLCCVVASFPFSQQSHPSPSFGMYSVYYLEREVKRGQYLLTVGLNCYKWYQNHTLGEDIGSGEWIEGSHVNWRSERVLVRTLTLKGSEL